MPLSAVAEKYIVDAPLETEHLGPFAGRADGQMSLRINSRGRTYAMLSGEKDEDILRLVSQLKVASRHHIATILGLGNEASKKFPKRLHRLGFLDRLVLDNAPPLYALGPEGRLALRAEPQEWDVLRCLRLAAANSFWSQFKIQRPDAEWKIEPHLGLTALLTLGQTHFGILVPRLWPGDIDWCRQLADLASDSGRLIILAASRQQAEELSRVVHTNCPVRYTWDRAGLVFYRRMYGALEVSETFSQNGIDDNQKPC